MREKGRERDRELREGKDRGSETERERTRQR